MINLQNIFDYAGPNQSQRNFKEGQRVFQAKHVILCGKLSSDNSCIKALCLQTTHIREKPHEITGKIEKDGKIIEFKCSCVAGLSGKCKHILATLFHCFW